MKLSEMVVDKILSDWVVIERVSIDGNYDAVVQDGETGEKMFFRRFFDLDIDVDELSMDKISVIKKATWEKMVAAKDLSESLWKIRRKESE